MLSEPARARIKEESSPYAVAFNTQRWQGTEFKVDHLLDAVAELFKVLRERRVNYALVGGIALLKYVQGRNTEDIDLILSVRSLKKLPEIVVTHKDVYFACGNYKDLQVYFLLTKNRLFSHAKKHHVVTQNSLSNLFLWPQFVD